MLGPPPGAVAIKDPTAVHHDGAWHLFTTVRPPHRIEYLRCDALPPSRVERTILNLGVEMAAAPQVFRSRANGLFFLVFQAHGPFDYGPAFSTNESLDPAGWTKAAPIALERPAKRWLDFWAIGDGDRMHLFHSSLDGRLWRAETTTEAFPRGFGASTLAISGDLFEAAHVHAVGPGRFVCIAEAQRFGLRHQRWFTARALDGEWTARGRFASRGNVRCPWADAISHGELLRSDLDERMAVNPALPRFLFQGVRAVEMLRPYGTIPWRIGLLEASGSLPFDP